MTAEGRKPDNFADITTSEFGAHAIAGYDIIRRQGRLSWQPGSKGWLLTRYADAVQVLRNPEFAQADLSDMWRKLGRKLGKDYGPMLGLLSLTPFQHEGVRHEQLRRTIARAVAPFAGANEVFATRINKMLSGLRGSEGFDLAEDFANYVLFQIFCDLMEIEETDRSKIRQMSRISRILESTLSVKERDEVIGTISRSLDFLIRHTNSQIERGRPRPCLVGSIYRELPAEEPDKFEATARIVSIMLIMGNDALGSCISHGVLQLLGGGPTPQSEAIRQADWASVSDDVIRYASPVDLVSRIMQTDTAVAACPLNTGTRVIVSTLAANHDPEEFGRKASEISTDATGSTGLAFGAGGHVCIGNRISRNIVKEAFAALACLPEIRLAGPAKYARGRVVRMISSLPVEFI